MKSFIIDSHAHLNSKEFDKDRDQVVNHSFQNHISAILCPADLTEPDRLRIALDLNKKYKNILIGAGIHPHQAKLCQKDSLDNLKKLAEKENIAAIGEIGLDFHYNFSQPEIQISVFRNQLELANELGMPVIIHSRNASKEILEAISTTPLSGGGVFHCFTEDWHMAKKILDLNFYISFSGILTFPQAHEIRESAKKIPVDRVMVETDAPYLTPVPFRGKIKRNEPVYIRETAQILATLKKIPLEDLVFNTNQNFTHCFSFEL